MSASARPREESQAADPPSRSKKWIKVGVALGLVAAASQITARMIVTGAIVWWLVSDRLLGMLAGWAIAKTPKKFQWTIRSIVIRPSPRRIFTSLFGSNPENARDAWSEIIVQGWQWHSPDSFVNGPNMLEIDRLTIRLELFSVYRAIAYKEAIQIDLMQARRQEQRANEPPLSPLSRAAPSRSSRACGSTRTATRTACAICGRRSTCPTAPRVARARCGRFGSAI